MAKVRMSNRDNNEHIKRHNIEIHNISETLRVMIEAEKINESLQIQDEEDRHSIALWGMNKTHNFKSILQKDEKPEHEDSPDKMNMTSMTYPYSMNSTNEFPHPSSHRHRDIQTSFRVKSQKRSENPVDDRQKLEELTQRSLNFAPKSTRKAASVQRGSVNPMHFKRSLPQIMQTKNSKNAAGIIKIDNKCFSCTSQSAVVLNAFKIACLGYFPTNVKYKNNVYSRFTLLTHRAKLISQHWEKVKLCAPFGEIEEKIPKWAPTKVINIEDLMETRTELPERAHTSFDIQPPTNASVNDDLNYKYDTFGRTAAKFKDLSKIDLVNKIFDGETPISAQLTKSNTP